MIDAISQVLLQGRPRAKRPAARKTKKEVGREKVLYFSSFASECSVAMAAFYKVDWRSEMLLKGLETAESPVTVFAFVLMDRRVQVLC